jgi:putative phage-type endonuclease
MTLHEFPGLEQGTDAWHDARRGIVTASVVGRLINPTLKVADNDYSRGITAALIAERIAGWTEPSYTNADMWRGVECEPIARGAYTQHYAPAVECGFLRRDEPTWSLGYSPDGLVGDDGLIEIKAPRAKGHVATILADNVPAQYMAQCQAGLLVTGRKWLDFVSFCGGLPLYVKRIEPDPRWLEVIVAAVEKFETTAAEMVAAYHEATEGLPATERVVELEMSL